MKKELIKSNIVFKGIYTLYHVGTADIKNKSKNSYEGNGLSVSICPSAWCKIAKIGSSDVWALKKSNMRLLDYYSLKDDVLDKITNWGIENEYLEEVYVRYVYEYFDEELDRTVAVLCYDFKSALEETCEETQYESYEDYLLNVEAEHRDIYPYKTYKATEKLRAKSLIDIPEGDMSKEQNFLIYIEENTDYDGVYWDDKFDILGLSAPRGVIFNSKIETFHKNKISWNEVDEITEEELY